MARMAPLKLYYDLLSQPSRALFIFLNKNKIPFEDKAVHLSKAEHHSDEFEKINPFRLVPVIADGDFKLRESVAILRYLCREKNVPDHWYPKDSKAQARVDEYLEWQHTGTRLHCAMYFQVKWLQPLLTGRPATDERVEPYKERMIKCLDDINDIWLKDHPYLAGDKISVADILGACEVEQPRMAGYDPCVGRPKLAAWLARVRSELSPDYETAHVRLNRLVDRYKGVPPTSVSKL